MALGKNQFLMIAGVAGVAALFYGYTIYQENPDLTLGDLANLEKLKKVAAAAKPNILEQQKGKVMAKLDEARKAQAAREDSMAQQTGDTNLKAVGDSTVDKAPGGGPLNAKTAVKAIGAKAADSAAAADAALDGKAAPGAPVPTGSAAPKAAITQTAARPAASPSAGAGAPAPAAAEAKPPAPRDPKAENDRLLSLVRGITPVEDAPKAPPKLAMVDPEMQHTIARVKPAFEDRPRPERETRPRKACKKIPRDQVLAFIKKEANSGLGSFTLSWSGKFGACSDELIAVAADAGQDMGLRYFTLQAALEVGGLDSADGVAKLLKDKNAGIRCIALLGLGEMGDKTLTEKFVPLLKDPAMVVRECALNATVRSQGQDSLPQVVDVIADPRNYVKGHPLSIVKRGFDLLDAMGAGTSQQDACNALKEKMGAERFGETTRKWAVCAQSQGS